MKIAASVLPEAAIVLATRGVPGPANAPLQISVWDQTDLDENKGSDILEFVGPKPANDARVDSNVAVSARSTSTANVFYVGFDNFIRSGFSTTIASPFCTSAARPAARTTMTFCKIGLAYPPPSGIG